ncbi:hypothetical protein FA95DRAFT_1563318 [Auriscalpium vulgare]|uniref:Uncharacterized protein n=1 Tax=Auriscalpium vulgare TaxID=40419 RepID=A0ACB8RHL9_9AGAM|nr:hypothetical protein FA95DRAFT_1563318 [Auriscalpium vulgare]
MSAITVTTSAAHSHPTEPLLHASTPYASTFHDLLTRQPPHPDTRSPTWDMPLSLEGDPVTAHERRGYWERTARKRLRRLRAVDGAILLAIGAWALYTAVRYFIAYVIYPAAHRQTVALALGISSLVSLTATLLIVFRYLIPHRLLLHDLPKFLRFRLSPPPLLFPLIASLFLLAPAAVNFALVFVWHRSSTPGLSLQGRCRWDLDVVWVGTGGQCQEHAAAWGAWLAAAAARLGLTAAALVGYHCIHRAHQSARLPSSPYFADLTDKSRQVSSPPLTSPRRTLSLRRVSLSPRNPPSDPFSPPPRPHSFFNTRPAIIPDVSPEPAHGHGHVGSMPSLTDATTEDDVHGVGSSESGGAPPRSLRRVRSVYDMQQGGSSRSSEDDSGLGFAHDDSDLQGFADRFRNLVSQVSRDIEDGLDLRSSASKSSSPSPSPSPPPPMPAFHHVLDTHIPYTSIDEFGRPSPPDERIAVLGGVVRRMPTIESVGSRERDRAMSSMGAWPPSPTTASLSSSRPPTRATMLSISVGDNTSQPPSRSNSLTYAAPPRGVPVTEVGELSSPRSSVRGSSGTSTSYHTAPPSGGSSTRSSGGEVPAGGAPPRSRSNSLGATEVLTPVTEHGESGELIHRLVASPEQLSPAPHADPLPPPGHVHDGGGGGAVTELGELGPGTVHSHDFAHSLPSVASYHTAPQSSLASSTNADSHI